MILTIIICIIVSYIVRVVYFEKEIEEMPGMGKVGKNMFTILVGLILGLFVACLIGVSCPCETHCQQSELKAIEDEFGVQGRFFLGCGTIGTEQYYVFYRKRQEDGGFEYDKIRAETVIIYEEEGREKAVIKECIGTAAGYSKYFGIGCKDLYQTKIYVQKGTIKEGCNLDLQ